MAKFVQLNTWVDHKCFQSQLLVHGRATKFTFIVDVPPSGSVELPSQRVISNLLLKHFGIMYSEVGRQENLVEFTIWGSLSTPQRNMLLALLSSYAKFKVA